MSVHDEKHIGRRLGRWPVLDYPLGIISALLLLGLTALTCVDVVARYWFNAPVNGAFELTQMMLAGLIFAALPMTTARGEHVEVDLFSIAAGRNAEIYFHLIGGVISAVVLFALGYSLWRHADRLLENGAVTNSLALPFAPAGYFAAVSCGLSGAIVLIRLVIMWRNK